MGMRDYLLRWAAGEREIKVLKKMGDKYVAE